MTAGPDSAPGGGSRRLPGGRRDRRPPSTPFLLATRIILLLGGGVIAVCLVATTTYAVAGVLVRTSERADDTLTGTFDRVDVHVSGSIDIHPGPEGEARIVRRSDYSFDQPEVTQRIVEGVLELSYECRGVSVICHHDVDLAVPPGVELVIEANHAVVTDTTGPVRIRSGGGAAELERVSGPVDVQVGGGSVTGRDLRSTHVEAKAGGGSVELDFAEPPEWVDTSAGAGHIGIVLPRGEASYRVDADAGLGDSQVSVRTDPVSPRIIRASAGAGDVVVRYGPD